MQKNKWSKVCQRYRDIELFRMEKSFQSIELNCLPSTVKVTTKQCPSVPLLPKYLQGWWFTTALGACSSTWQPSWWRFLPKIQCHCTSPGATWGCFFLSYRLLLGKICATTLTNFYGYGASVGGQGFFSGHFQFSLALWLLRCCLAVIKDDVGTWSFLPG